jgi:DNA-binding CsgD family transcriptional regulator
MACVMRGGREAIAALALQALDLALVAVDERRRILLANRACADILRNRDDLQRREGRLVGRGAEVDDALEGMLRRLGLGRGRAAVGRIGGFFTVGVALSRSRRVYLLLFVDERRPIACAVEDVARVFALSPAEARLAHALASGRTLEQHAAAAEVALSTVRTQLRYVLKKLRVHRQSDLVRVIAGLPALRARH